MRLKLAACGVVAALLGAALPALEAGDLVISQVYGGGGNTGAPYTTDYIEILNRGAAPVSLAGLSLQYASATGTGNFGANSAQLAELPAVTLAPGQYFLLAGASGATGGPLPTPDVVDATPINLSGSAGKVALVTGTVSLGCNGGSTPCGAAQLAQIVDLVGYGNANFFEGATAAPTLSNTTAAFRSGDGCVDTDVNGADFTAGPPAPRTSASTLAACGGGDAAPTVASTSPADGAQGVPAGSTVTIAFSEPVSVVGAWFSIDCAVSGSHTASVSGGPQSFVLAPDVPFAPSESCAVTVDGSLVADLDLQDPPDTMAGAHAFAFATAAGCGSPATFVHEVQGSGATSPLVGQAVSIEGVVVASFQGGAATLEGFFVQEEDQDADGDPLTSEGVFVFTGSAPRPVAVGDRVRVSGTVVEFNGLTELSSVTGVEVCASGLSVTPAEVSLPFPSATHPERFEGMAISIPQTLTATEVFDLGRFGEVLLSSGGRLRTPTNVVDPGAPATALAAQNALNQIVLDDARDNQNPDPTPFTFDDPATPAVDPTLRLGSTVANLRGVLSFGFGAYRIEPTEPPAFVAANPRPLARPDVGGTVTVAAANVLNYFNGDGQGGGFPTSRGADTLAEFERQRAKAVAALHLLDADVTGLMEVENDSTAGEYSAIEDLVDALNAVPGADPYAFVDTDVIGTDEIRVALLYKPSKVTPVGTTGVLFTGTFSDRSRPPVAQAFEDNASGQRFVVVVNHFKSKGCGGATGLDLDQGDGQSCFNATRVQSAQELTAWLATDPTGTGETKVLVIGDLNSYLREDPIVALENAGYVNGVASHIGSEASSFVFNGEAGALDHAFFSPSLAALVTGVAELHNNADEPPVLDYNLEFKSAAQAALEEGTPYRAADHDSIVVGLRLEAPQPDLVNGGMELDDNRDLLPDGWTGNDLVLLPIIGDGRDCRIAAAGECSFRFRPSLWAKRLAQSIDLDGRAGDGFDLGYQVKTHLVSSARFGQARIVFQSAAGTSATVTRNLPTGTRDWSAAALQATAPFDYVRVRVEFALERLIGTTWIDEVTLTRN